MSIIEKAQRRLAKQVDKYDQLLAAAYALFLEQGYEDVTIQEIAARAGVAKGTFYLYFHDKDDLKEQLITQKSNEMFQAAVNALRQTHIERFDDQIIFVVNYIIDILNRNQPALKLIAKNLSLGVFNEKLNEMFTDDDADIVRSLILAAEKSGVRLKNPKVLLFMIIELASSTCFSCILKSEPLEISVYKPYLFEAIRQLTRAGTQHDGCARAD